MEQNMIQQPQDNPSLDYWANNNMAWSNNIVPSVVEEEQHQQQSHFGTDHEPTPQISVKPGFGYYASTEENSQPQVSTIT